MARVQTQSEESKYIKKINQQMKDVFEKLAHDEGENPLAAVWSRAVRESGLTFSQDLGTGRYRIENTKANRENIQGLISSIAKYKPQTIGEYKQEIKQELTQEATQIAAAKQLDDKEREKFIKQYTSKKAVAKRVEIHGIEREINSMLKVIYSVQGKNAELGEELSEAASGLKYSERDSAEIYDIFGRIREEVLRIQRDELTEQERRRIELLRRIQGDYI